MKHNFIINHLTNAAECKICGKRLTTIEKHLNDKQINELRETLDAEDNWQEIFNDTVTEMYPCLTDTEYMVKDIIE